MKKLAWIMACLLLCGAAASCAPSDGDKQDTTAPEQTQGTTADTEPEAPTEQETESEAPTEAEHTHTLSGWERDLREHWQVCADGDGEKLNAAPHQTDEEGFCDVCNSLINLYGEGEDCLGDVNTYDEDGNVLQYTVYNPDGGKNYEIFTEYAEDGEGNTYQSKETQYDFTAGEIYVSEYNQYEDQTSRTISDMEGNVLQADRFEREYNAEGEPLWEKEYTNDVLVREITGYKVYVGEDYTMRFPESVIDYNEDGTKLVTVNGDNGEVATETIYKADGTVEWERSFVYETDGEGNWTSIKAYENGRLTLEQEYALDGDGWSYMAKETEYPAEGGKIVREFDSFGEQISETVYDAAGNVVA